MNDVLTVELSEKSSERIAEKILARMGLFQPKEKEMPTVVDAEKIFRGARDASAYLKISTGTFQALKNEGKMAQVQNPVFEI